MNDDERHKEEGLLLDLVMCWFSFAWSVPTRGSGPFLVSSCSAGPFFYGPHDRARACPPPAAAQVAFSLKTASHDGHEMKCSGPTCPIQPQKALPVVPYQMMYEPKVRKTVFPSILFFCCRVHAGTLEVLLSFVRVRG